MRGAPHHDLVVVGVGGIGAAILERASREGWRVLGIERHGSLDHEESCSWASSRGFRQTYPGNLRHRDWAWRSRERWLALDERARRELSDDAPLFFESGATITAPRDHPIFEGVQRAARDLATPCEVWSEARHGERFATLPGRFATLYESAAGWIDGGRALGAPLQVMCEGRGPILARAVVLCTAGENVPLLDASGDPLDGVEQAPEIRHRRQIEHWFELPRGGAHELGMFHVVDAPRDMVCGGVIYGIPERDDLLKCCVPEDRKSVRTARGRFAAIRRAEIARAEGALEGLFGGRVEGLRHVGARMSWSVETPNGAFLLGRHPRSDRLWLASAFCGHGFKMFPAISDEIVEEVAEGL